jgi:predicted amidohydrolase
MKIAAVQMTSVPEVEKNVQVAIAQIERAAGEGAELVVLPEFFNTIFFAQYWDNAHHALAESVDGRTITAIREAARRNDVDVVATIYEKEAAGLFFDTAMHIARSGDIRHKYRKVHPAAVLSLEKLYFRYGTQLGAYQYGDWRIGIGICYDMAFPETARCLAIEGAELIIAPYATSRVEMFLEVLRTRAFENGCYLIAANKVGREGEWSFGGQSAIIDPFGKVLSTADTQNEALLIVDIDRARVDEARLRFPTWRDRRPDLYGAITTEVDSRL